MDDVKESSPPADIGLPEPHPGPVDPTAGIPLRQASLDPIHTIFVGRQGLRAGWRFLLYVGMWRASFLLLRVVVQYVQPHEFHGIWLNLIGELEFLGSAILPALVMAAIEKRPFGDYGLPRKYAFGKSFWVGLVWGIAAITFLVVAVGGAGDFSLGGLALHGWRILKFAAFWGGFFVIVGLFEEFLLRGYTQFTLTQGIGFWPAALFLSTCFAALHIGNPGETWLGLLAVAAIGLFFCLTLRRTGNLWFAVGFHASWDWGESYLYSVPDSGGMVTGHLMRSSFHGSHWITGGSVGPEGSVLVFVVLAVTWLAFDRAYPEAKYRTGFVSSGPA
jgi:membrane protease YdiL (CAAX protease family)